MINFKKIKKGFALLYAMLISSLVLSISMGVFNVAMRYYMLESANRESQYAFYAADSAAECMYYWDARWQNSSTLKESPFAELDSTYLNNPLPDNTALCSGQDLKGIISYDTADSSKVVSAFTLIYPDDRKAIVEVTKTGSGADLMKEFAIYGFNRTDDTDPRVVQRMIWGNFQ